MTCKNRPLWYVWWDVKPCSISAQSINTVMIWKHLCFILSMGTRIWIDSVICPQFSSRGCNTSASVTFRVYSYRCGCLFQNLLPSEILSSSLYAAARSGLVLSWSENISVSFCLQGYGLTLWCALGVLVGCTIQVPQLQLQLQRVLLPSLLTCPCMHYRLHSAGIIQPALCRLNCNNVALSDNLDGVWRLFYSGRGTMALCDSL